MSKSLRFAVALIGFMTTLHAQQRIRSTITDSPTFTLKNDIRPVIAHCTLQDDGPISSSRTGQFRPRVIRDLR